MIWVVGGTMRSGTSMMMRAISKSSQLKPKMDERMNRVTHTGYDANPHGFYEASHTDRSRCGWPLQCEGMLVKCFPDELLRLPAHEYSVVFMMRDAAEVMGSLQAAFNAVRLDVATFDLERQIVVGILEKRQDINLTVLNYAEVVASPKEQFTKLADAGWPLNPRRATAFIDPALYRIKTTEMVTQQEGQGTRLLQRRPLIQRNLH